ncbi:hypothetical protein [Pseudarthrobacter sp. DSP2-3-2b1]|uniref:hypothetical protein n=1 Tax=Pseudarthrobacter sp. DSP2-3-2b1 TaxID=2804661 RepID=UPI003CF5368C
MSNQFSVGADEAARKTGAIDSVVASLPLSLAHATAQPDIVAVDGSVPAWSERAQEALDSGARVTVIISPTLMTGLAPQATAQMVFDWAFASNPAVQKAAEAATALIPHITLLESRLVLPAGADLDQSLMDQLTAIAQITGDSALAPGSLRCLFADQHGYHFAGALNSGAPVTVSAVVSAATNPHLGIRLLTVEESMTVYIPAPDTAAPAEVRVTTHEGELLLPTEYEAAHRTTWRRAIRLLTEETDAEDYAQLLKTASVLRNRLDP